jgi:hypothetical protein
MVFSPDPLTGVNCVFVSFVLWVIAGNLRGKVGAKETAYLCILTACINGVTAVYLLFVGGNPVGFGAFLLFSFTYFFFAMDLLGGADTVTGLGNYCLGVAVVTIPYFVLYLGIDTIQAIIWLIWGQLWFLFYLANARGIKKVVPFMIADTYFVCLLQFAYSIFHHLPIFRVFG